MAKHKAPTQVTIATIQEKTLFHELVDRYWKLAALVAIAVTAGILIPAYRRNQERAGLQSLWDDLRSRSDFGSGFFVQVQGGTPEALAQFAEENKGSAVSAWAKAVEVGSLIQDEKLDQAEAAAAALQSGWGDHLVATTPFYPDAAGQRHTLADVIRTGKADMAAWEKEHAFLFENPALAADAPRVRFNTNKGAIVFGLYSDRVPQHVEAFLKLCRDGAYSGTKFHQVERGSFLQGGDPNTISGEPESWGQGGSAEGVDGESDPTLRHFKGALAAWRAPGAKRSHASQFLITTSNQNQRDGQTVVFGRVLEGESTLEAIESSPVVDGRPQDPAVVESVEVL
ncbi:MAG: peptidylprolyl isomerase, partial [Planctomycetota bacterium]